MRDLAAQVRAAAQEMPIDRLIRRLNDASLSEEYRDKLAAIAAPYTAPRLSSVAITKRALPCRSPQQHWPGALLGRGLVQIRRNPQFGHLHSAARSRAMTGNAARPARPAA